ncbi:MAG: hypothetical protein ACI9MJ_000121 [Alphaproteobacteria bacterium]|jgi:hypothetical protein
MPYQLIPNLASFLHSVWHGGGTDMHRRRANVYRVESALKLKMSELNEQQMITLKRQTEPSISRLSR